MAATLRRKAYGLVGGGVVVTADPSEIAWTLPRRRMRELPLRTRAGINMQFFPDGPWDLAAAQFGIHRYVKEIFLEHVPVEQSEQYRDMVARVMGPGLGGEVWGCRTLADVDRYFDGLLRIFDDMRVNGYRSHADLGGTPQDEVKVRIGREGQLIKASGGNHRVSFAKLLEIDRIPVLVCGIHKGYLRRRVGASTAWTSSAVADALTSAGLADFRAWELAQLARRLQAGNVLRHAAGVRQDLSRRSGFAEGTGAVISLYDDVHTYLQPLLAQGAVPL